MKAIALVTLIAISMVSANVYPNLNIIDEINSLETTWIAGENKRFTNMQLEEIKGLMGSLETPPELLLPQKKLFRASNLPENFDLREAYPQCESLKEIRDQSACGSCWAFGAVEAMSDRICIASGQKLQTRISAEDLVSCCWSCGFGCNGGFPSSAWTYFKNTGLVTGGLYQQNTTCQPYKFKPCDHHMTGKYGPCPSGLYPTPSCESTCNKDYVGPSFSQDKWHAKDAYSIARDEQAIMTEIFNHGSVEVSFTVFEDLLSYKSGVYQHKTGSALGGHAVKAIGWGVENGVKYWLIVNSWNEGWGDNGLVKILRGSNHCGIESGVVAGTVVLK